MSLTIIRGDITQVTADFIVNPTDSFYSGKGGTDYAIHQAAGPKLKEYLKEAGTLRKGNILVTPAFDLTNAKYIIHTVGPIWEGGSNNERKILHSCYSKALFEASRRNAKSIAFPLIASGTFHYPPELAAEIALEALQQGSETFANLEITLVLFQENKNPVLEGLFPLLTRYIQSRYRMDTNTFLDGFASHGSHTMDVVFANEELDTELESDSLQTKECEEEKFFLDELSSDRRCFSKTHSPHWDNLVLPPLGDSLQDILMEYVNRYLERTGKKESTVYAKAIMRKDHYSKIKSGKIVPRKYALLSLAIALELTKAETERMLKSAGYALSDASLGDLVIGFFLEEGFYDIDQINQMLLSYDATLLGSF